MRRTLIILTIALLAAGCQQHVADTATMHTEATFALGDNAELRLLSDGNLAQLELYYGGELQELVGTANTHFMPDEAGVIRLDTVHLGSDTSTQYIVHTADRSSTYGAEVWYVLYPYRHDDPDGPWNIAKVPTDRPSIEDVAQYLN